MFYRALRYVRLPIVLLALWTCLRFAVGVSGVPYAPRGNAMFSVFGLTLISCLYFGAMSGRVGGFGWGGAALSGALIGFAGQLFIFTATLVSYLAGIDTYFTHWDALNIPEGTTATMAQAMGARTGGLVAGTIAGTLFALVGRLLAKLAPQPAAAPEAVPAVAD